MEKIENPELVKLLRKNRHLYNELFAIHMVQYPDLDGETVFRFISEKIDPAMSILSDTAESSGVGESTYETIFQILYEKTLKLTGSMGLNLAWDGYGDLVKIPGMMKHITIDEPELFLETLFSAAEKLINFSPEKFSKWVALLMNLAENPHHIKDLETFRTAGRFAAWMCGMASLREKVIHGPDISDKLFTSLKVNTQKPEYEGLTLNDIKGSPWFTETSGDNFTYRYTVSGFRGFEGHFIRPPVISQINGRFLATDGEQVFSVFTDAFGSMVTEISAIEPVEVINGCRTKVPKNITFLSNNDRDIFKDIRSVAATEDTVIISRDRSHQLYIYGNRG